MRYKVAGLTLVVLATACATSFVYAQKAEDSSRETPKLADRLDQLRRDIFGDSRSSDRTTANRASRTPSRSTRAGSAAHRSSRSSGRPRSQPSQPTELAPQAAESQPPVAGGRVPRRVRTADRRSTTQPEASSSSSAAPPAVSVGTEVSRSSRGAATEPTKRANSSRRLVPQAEAASPYPRGASPRTAAAPRRAAKPQPANPRSVKPEPVEPEPAKSVRATPTRVNVTPQPAASSRRESSVVKRPPKPASPAVTSRLTTEVEADAVLFAQRSPLLRVETLGPRRIVVGKESTYKVRIQNLGEVGADSVVVQVRLPKDADVVSSNASHGNTRPVDGAKGGPDYLEWEIDHVGGRSHEQLTVKLIPRDSREFELAVNWSSAAASSQTRIEVQEPMLQLALDGPNEVIYGDTKIYRLTVANPGTGDADNVAIQLMSIDGGNQPAAHHKLGTILAGDSKVLEIELTARQAGSVKINAIASGDGNLRSEVKETVLVRRAGLKVEVVGPPVKYSGTSGSYTVHVSNPGNATARKVQVVASLPPGVTDVEPSNRGRVDEAAGQVEWTIGPLSAGQTRQLQVRYTVKSPGANVLKVAAETDGDVTDSGVVSTQVEATADLKLEVSDPSGPIAVGEEMVYTVRVRNRGSKEAKDVELFGFFSEGVEPVEVRQGSGELSPGQVIFDVIEDLRAGSEKVFKIVAKADQSGTHIFHAEVRCTPLDTRLVAEESTLFYETQARAPAQPSARPAAAPAAPRRPAPVKVPAKVPATSAPAADAPAPAAVPTPAANPAPATSQAPYVPPTGDAQPAVNPEPVRRGSVYVPPAASPATAEIPTTPAPAVGDQTSAKALTPLTRADVDSSDETPSAE